MNISFNLNYMLFLGLSICLIILIYMLFKHIFVKEISPNNQNSRDNPNKKNLPTNIDFFNTTAKIIEKSNKVVDEKNNKVYYYLDLGDKILIMEDTLFVPENESLENESMLFKDNAIETFERPLFAPEINSSAAIEKDIYENDADEIKNIITKSDEDYNQLHKELADMVVNDPELILEGNNDTSFID